MNSLGVYYCNDDAYDNSFSQTYNPPSFLKERIAELGFKDDKLIIDISAV